jgi:hypothetical protein
MLSKVLWSATKNANRQDVHRRIAASAFRRCYLRIVTTTTRMCLVAGTSLRGHVEAHVLCPGRMRNTLKQEAILYISGHAASSDSVAVELEAEGYEVVSADSSSQGAALMHIMHSVAAVVLHYQPEDRTWFELAQNLRAIRPGVPIILLSRDPVLYLPPWVDACVGTEQPVEEVASAVHSLLTGERYEAQSAQC